MKKKNKLQGSDKILEFTEFAKGIEPFIPPQKTDADLFAAIIGNFLKDSAIDSCKLLAHKADTQYRYVNGKPIPKKEATYLYQNKNPEKFSKWIADSMDEADSYEDMQSWLKNNGYPGEYPDDECAKALEDLLLSICNDSDKQKKASSPFEKSLELIDDINQKIKTLPRPTPVDVPDTYADSEEIYIKALFDAYGDAESIDDFSETELQNFSDYQEDLEDRRIDYYAAVSIQRGVLELNADKLSDQFDVLKSETLDGVKDTAKKRYPDGYEKMLSVMEQAANLPVNNYLLSKSPYWISGKIKKGVCHHLVNDGKLIWVKKK